ncbi:cation diffusion facilitator family transporter [Naasia lichenicola]|uniref:Cobalt transporter n=1 Tax=Naasia lichenicola TaxID=2565933 RepID=A0A4S4FKW7_9MICO|nr:cation transporter [Naasia lichenicola]THG31040.1 cobalt transporter [Naasia lichenicola]
MTTTDTARIQRRSQLQRRIRLIVGITIAYNLIEAIIAISAGAAASSVALIGFGLDSTIEVLSAAAVAWQFTRRDPERWEKPTLRVIAVAFFALAAYVSVTSLMALFGAVEVEHSTLGIVITALSVVIMPFLSLAERRAGRELGSATAIADSKQTLICTYLSAAVLIGLILNSLFGLWWADSVAALVIVVFAIREGVEAWKGDACATSVGMLLDDDTDEDHHHEHEHEHEHEHIDRSPRSTVARRLSRPPARQRTERRRS